MCAKTSLYAKAQTLRVLTTSRSNCAVFLKNIFKIAITFQ